MKVRLALLVMLLMQITAYATSTWAEGASGHSKRTSPRDPQSSGFNRRDNEQVKRFNPQPDPPKERVQVKRFNPQPDPPKEGVQVKRFNPQPDPPKEGSK